MTITIRRGRHAQAYAPPATPQERTWEEAPTLPDIPGDAELTRAMIAAHLTELAVSPPF